MVIRTLHLLVRSFAALPSSLGSNWLGLLFPLLVFMLTQCVTGVVKGKTYMKAHWKENVLLGFAVAGAAWAGLFAWCVVTTVDGDHTSLNAHIRQLHNENVTVKTNFDGERRNLAGQIGDLKTDCAVKDGIAQTLQKQNRDQQSSINGCLTQAIKMIPTPEPLKTEYFLLGRQMIQMRPRPGRATTTPTEPQEPQAIPALVYLVITNRVIRPPRVIVSCDAAIQNASGNILTRQDVEITGTFLTSEGSGRMSDTQYRVAVNHDWTPMDPMMVTVLSPTAKKCTFTPE